MLGQTLAHLEADALRAALAEAGGVQRAAARSLGITATVVRLRLRQYGIDPATYRPAAPTVPDNPRVGQPFCGRWHAWSLVYRHPGLRGILRVWHCTACPAVRTEGPSR